MQRQCAVEEVTEAVRTTTEGDGGASSSSGHNQLNLVFQVSALTCQCATILEFLAWRSTGSTAVTLPPMPSRAEYGYIHDLRKRLLCRDAAAHSDA